VGQIGGVTNAVVLDGTNLFFHVGPRIARSAISASTPLSPTQPALGDILPGVPVDLKVANGYLYVAMGSAGVAVVDATTLNPLSMQKLPAGSAVAVAVGPQHLFVAAETAGIVVYDIGGDNKTLTFAETKTFSSPARRITDVETRTISGQQYLFVAGDNNATLPANRGGVLKFNVTTPGPLGTPIKVQQLDVRALRVTDGFVMAVGNTAFYALDTTELGLSGGVSATLVLTQPALNLSLNPTGNTAYLMNNGGGVDVLDVSTPTAPQVKSAGDFFTNGLVKDLAVAEFGADPLAYLHLADHYAGLSIATMPKATPGVPVLNQPGIFTPQPAVANLVATAYPQVFAYGVPASLLSTINAAGMNVLSPVGPGINPGVTTIHALTTYSDTLLVSADNDGLLRFHITPGSEPTFVDSVSTGGPAHATAVQWPLAVVANSTQGLAIMDLSDSMVVTGSAPAPAFNSNFSSVAVQGNYAYIGDSVGVPQNNAGAFRIYDFSDPTLPTAAGVLSQTGILDVKVSGNLAFLAVGAGGIRVVNITNPMSPTLIGEDDFTTLGPAQSLIVYKNYLFVAEDSAGVQMFSFQPSGLLSLVTTIPTPGNAKQLAWTPGRLYVAAEDAGLLVIEIGADVAFTKTAPATVYAGQNFTYTLKVDNIGPVVTNNVVITDALPENVTFVVGQSCTSLSGVVTCTLPSLAINASATFSVVVKSSETGVITNTAHIYSDLFDVNRADNTSSATTSVLPAADLAVIKTASLITGTAGVPFTYTVRVNNLGPSTATHVVMTDTLPSSLQLLSVIGSGCSSSQPVVCNLVALNASATTSITLVVLPAASGAITNTARIGSDVYDPNLLNNTTTSLVTEVRMYLWLPVVTR
jgi:uncharacterized repeat protein (TIGR01451 family)